MFWLSSIAWCITCAMVEIAEPQWHRLSFGERFKIHARSYAWVCLDWVLGHWVLCAPWPRSVVSHAWVAAVGGQPGSALVKDRPLLDPGQVTDLWVREGLLLSCRGFRLFSDRLIGGGDMWRSKHHIEAWPQVWGLGVQIWIGIWNPWQEWNGLVSLVPGVQARRVFFEVPSWVNWFMNRRFYMTVRVDYDLAP
jgi:hypothetical protein